MTKRNKKMTATPNDPKDKNYEKKINDFIEEGPIQNIDSQKRKTKKEASKQYHLRLPQSLWEDLQEIHAISGLSINAICLELLRPAIKKKLTELKQEE